MTAHSTAPRRARPDSLTALAGHLAAALLVAVAPARALADAPWGYRIGEEHQPRQVNLCETEAQARELAAIFRKYGVRPGFAALSNAPACARRVVAVVPMQVLETVVVAPRTANEYRVSFVLVEVGEEPTRAVLVTTRPVAAP